MFRVRYLCREMKNKPATTNDYQQRINRVVEYIRMHLDEAVDLRVLAELSAFSPYHFHRIVSAMLGEPIGEFIVRTRIETAARLLRYTDVPVAEIAYRVGYDTPSSLSKAFRRFFGISPKMYRITKNRPMMNSNIQPDAEIRLSKPKIREIPVKTVAYIRAQGNYSEVDYGSYFTRLWSYVKEHKLFSAGIENLVIYHNDPDISQDGQPPLRRMPDPAQGTCRRGRHRCEGDCRGQIRRVPLYRSVYRTGRRLQENLRRMASGRAAARCARAPASRNTSTIPTGFRPKN